jgi:hypothetical protein
MWVRGVDYHSSKKVVHRVYRIGGAQRLIGIYDGFEDIMNDGFRMDRIIVK